MIPMTKIEKNRMSDIRAIEYARHGEPAVDIAARVADAAIAQLAHDSDVVHLDFTGVRGTASSYFNVLFGAIVDAIGTKQFESRVKLIFETHTQQLVATRSREAVLKTG